MDSVSVSLPDGRHGRTLVAGIGNIFLGDDGFGVETVRRLTGRPLPPGVDLMDAGIRGVHLAYRLLDGYRRLVLVDTVGRGDSPGTLSVIEVDPLDMERPDTDTAAPAPMDGHGMDPASVLRLVRDLRAGAGGSLPGQVLVIGCRPLSTAEGIGLSPPVAAAVGPAADLVLDLVRRPPAASAAPATEPGTTTAHTRS
ncbi:hydrogenase maturation protease [Streptomyces sp. NPDC088116]|uniref:hydrogenase maturation protease n=1 Tax=Streptomyces sp. NPDC088116 TaxID=3365825 RepID=UPI0037F37391